MNIASVEELLTCEGMAPRFTFEGFRAAVQLADVISYTIQRPIKRAQFVANAAADLVDMDYQPFEGLENVIYEEIEAVEGVQPSPQGSVEVWDSFLRWVKGG